MMRKKKQEVIAIIPARGGSKGIFRKNIVDLCGMPLIAYTIQAALKAELITKVVVSTEDEEIAEISKKWGAEIPFLRPKELASDASGIWDVISYTITKLGGNYENRAYVELYPTSPFRTPVFIDKMVRILFKGYSNVITVKEVSVAQQFLYVQEDKRLINILGENESIPAWKKYYRSYPLFIGHLPQKKEKHYYHVLTNKCMFIDIDTPSDLRWAEAIINNRLFDFGF
jgi:CMP-N-acetylneuraminic acid synthetase